MSGGPRVDLTVDSVEFHDCDCRRCDHHGEIEWFRGTYIARCCAAWAVRSSAADVAQLALVEHLASEHDITIDRLRVPLPIVDPCPEGADCWEPADCAGCGGKGYVIREPASR